MKCVSIKEAAAYVRGFWERALTLVPQEVLKDVINGAWNRGGGIAT